MANERTQTKKRVFALPEVTEVQALFLTPDKRFLRPLVVLELPSLSSVELVVETGYGLGFQIQTLETHRSDFFQNHSLIMIHRSLASKRAKHP